MDNKGLSEYANNLNDSRKQKANTANIDDTAPLDKKLVEKLTQYIGVLIKKKFKNLIKTEKIECYRDMNVIKIHKINTGTDANPIYVYYYDVSDEDKVYNYLEYKGSGTLFEDDFVRVYISNIIYIGFKI